MITVFVDGACEPRNPGGYGACAMVAFPGAVAGFQGATRPMAIHAVAKLIGNGPDMTNNIAEWRALKGTLEWLTTSPKVDKNDDIAIFMDSQLVVNQFSGGWATNATHLQTYKEQCKMFAAQLPKMVLTWLPRDQNWVADDLINKLYASNGIKVTVRKRK
jgi:ribonuclease HI